MLLRSITAAALAVGAANAFGDVSPFFLLSTQSLTSDVPQTAQIAAAEELQNALVNSSPQDNCGTRIIVSQPGLIANDLSNPKYMPHLSKRIASDRYATSAFVTDVLGSLDTRELSRGLAKRCSAEEYSIRSPERLSTGESDKKPESAVFTVTFAELPVEEEKRLAQFRQNDDYLHALIEDLQDFDHTLIYTTTPPPVSHSADYDSVEQSYEMDEVLSVFHTDLKRDLHAYPRAENSTNPQSDLALFEKYQFLSPGIFMGLSVSLLLFLILYVGVSAIANLEVSYMAFNKEMGPGAQKKQQ